jgi:polar amino acid transport system permease protein
MNLEILGWGRTGFLDELFFGALNTLAIGLAAFALGLVLGQLGAIAKLYGNPIARWLAEIYTTVVRAVPELVLIFILFFAGTRGISNISEALGFGPAQINEMMAAILVLGFVQGAYSTEVIRAAIQAIPQGQIEAARAFGMSGTQTMRRVIIPAMLPNALPGLANLWLIVIKDTALISVVGGSPELAQATKRAAGFTKHYFLFYVVAGAIYLVITLGSNRIIAYFEKNMRRGQAKIV